MGTQWWAKFTLTIVSQVVALPTLSDIPFLRNLKLNQSFNAKLNGSGLVYLFENLENLNETQ